MNRFENKTAVITGAAGGIGEATTRRIVSEGGKVVIADHQKKEQNNLLPNSMLQEQMYARSIFLQQNCRVAKS